MKLIFRLLVLALLAGGWTLAAASLYVVRSAGSLPFVGKIEVIPKNHLTFDDTYVDATQWKSGDELLHRDFYDRVVAVGKSAMLPQALATTPAPDSGKTGG